MTAGRLPEHIYEAAHKAHLAWAAEALGDGADNLLMRLGDVAVVDAVAPLIRVLVAGEMAEACEAAHDTAGTDEARFTYGHCAALARALRVPDCGDQYHGADGGPCGGCGFDVAEPTKETPDA